MSVSSRTRAYRGTSNQIISNNSITKLELNAETYDVLEEFDPITYHRFTAKNTGYYQIVGQVQWHASIDQSRHSLYIKKNGSYYTTYATANSSGTAFFNPVIAEVVYLDEGDYLEMFVYQATGVDQAIDYTEPGTFMAIHKVFAQGESETLELITNETTGAKFYIDKTLNYGEVIIISFITIFAIFLIAKTIFNFFWKK